MQFASGRFNSDHALHARKKKQENHNACLRVRSESAHGAAVWSCKTVDNKACLRGAATGGAEKNKKDLELPENDTPALTLTFSHQYPIMVLI